MTKLADIYDEFLQARQGGDSSAQKCFTDVFLEPKVDKERDPFRLYATDVGKCPRQVCYRLLSTTKDYESPEKQRNDQRMYDVAEYIEAVLTAAFMWKGDLISHQTPVPFAERQNWGGRTDLIVELDGHYRIIEVKTHRGNASNYTLPKVPHVHQASSYHWELVKEYGLDASPLLWYVSRDGSGEPNECEVPHVEAETVSLMDELDAARTRVKGAFMGRTDECLPPQLDKVLQLRSYGKSVSCEPDWQCGYCNYAGTCKPDMSKSTWAEFDKVFGWEAKKAADVEKLARWGEKNAEGMLHPLGVS